MPFTVVQKVLATSAAGLGLVLGAAGITVAATNSGSTPTQQQPASSQGTGDYTPANEQGKAEPAESATEANDPTEAKDSAVEAADASDSSDASDAPQAPTGATATTAGQG